VIFEKYFSYSIKTRIAMKVSVVFSILLALSCATALAQEPPSVPVNTSPVNTKDALTASIVSLESTLKTAQARLEAKAYAEAEALLSPWKTSKSAEVFELLGSIYEFQRQHQAAFNAYQHAVTLNEAQLNNSVGTMPPEERTVIALNIGLLSDLSRLEVMSTFLGNSKAAKAAFEKRKTVYEKLKHFPPESFFVVSKPSVALYQLGRMALHVQDLEKSQRYLTQALEYADSHAEPKSLILYALGFVAQTHGNLVQAEQYYLNALSKMRLEPSVTPLMQAGMLESTGLFYFYQGEVEKAKPYFSQTLVESQNSHQLEVFAMQAIFMLDKIKQISSNEIYISDDYQKKSVRLNPKKKKTLIYVNPGKDLPGWYATHQEMVMKAFQVWNEALGSPFYFELSENSRQYDIQVYWQNQAAKGLAINTSSNPLWTADLPMEKAGYTVSAYANSLILRDMTIMLSDSEGHPYSDKDLFGTILHETGHVFGLQEHSTNPKDVMYPGFPRGFSPSALSSNDIASLKLLYSLKPKYTNPSYGHLSDLYRAAGKPEPQVMY
jgi:tetratricopeptide (TPR) repeat protein